MAGRASSLGLDGIGDVIRVDEEQGVGFFSLSLMKYYVCRFYILP